MKVLKQVLVFLFALLYVFLWCMIEVALTTLHTLLYIPWLLATPFVVVGLILIIEKLVEKVMK